MSALTSQPFLPVLICCSLGLSSAHLIPSQGRPHLHISSAIVPCPNCFVGYQYKCICSGITMTSSVISVCRALYRYFMSEIGMESPIDTARAWTVWGSPHVSTIKWDSRSPNNTYLNRIVYTKSQTWNNPKTCDTMSYKWSFKELLIT